MITAHADTIAFFATSGETVMAEVKTAMLLRAHGVPASGVEPKLHGLLTLVRQVRAQASRLPPVRE